MSKIFHQNNSSLIRGGFTLFEVLLALAVFAVAVVGLITALNTAMEAALEVRHSSLLRQELESRIAYRQAIPLDGEKFVLEAKDNHGIRIEETLLPYSVKNKDGVDLQNIKKLTITAKMDRQSDSASILVSN